MFMQTAPKDMHKMKNAEGFLKRALEMYEKSATDLPDRAETLNLLAICLRKPGAQRRGASNFRIN